MKNLFSLSILLASFSSLFAQDVIYTISNNPTSPGISQVNGVDPNTGTGAGVPVTYNISNGTPLSAAMAYANGYIYYIDQADESNGGAFTVRSIPAADPLTPRTSTAVLTGDINGPAETANVSFRSMGARQDGYIYMTVSDATTMYLARFQAIAAGGATNFEMMGTIVLNGVAPADPYFRNGDIVFDGNGNMFALINEDQVGGNAVIYFAPAAAISTQSNGVTNLVTRYQVEKFGGGNYSEYVVGLAVASSGNLYIAVQDDIEASEGGVYLLTRNAQGNFVMSESPVTNISARNIADLATPYFPASTVLPVVYGDISAKIAGNSLLVNWSTSSEKNNDHFEIEVSKDGEHFTKIGTVGTKALNGSSDQTLHYSFSKSIDIPVAVMGISLFSLATILLLVNRKNKLLLSLTMVMGIGLTFASCSKSSDQVDVDRDSKLFVRIVQVDKDGKRSASGVIAAQNSN